MVPRRAGSLRVSEVDDPNPGPDELLGLVVGVVRRPDPVPCGACEYGEFDMCRYGRYTERGIKELDGYGSQLWCVETSYAVPSGRSWFAPTRVLVPGAGPIGLLAAPLVRNTTWMCTCSTG